MDIRLKDYFDGLSLERGRDYARRGHVTSIEALPDGALRGRVSNGRGKTYKQIITLHSGRVEGLCSCPVGHNCKHVAAVLMARAERQNERSSLAGPVQGWLSRVRESTPTRQLPEERPDDYPNNVKDRLLYVLTPLGAQLRIDTYKGRINAAGTALNQSIRRYDAANALRGAPAKFIRPVDLELLPALAQARMWQTPYSHGLPELFRPKGDDAVALLRRVADTGRLLHDNAPDAQLTWSDERPEPRLTWHMKTDGSQRLGFEDASGQALDLRGMEGATVWIDPAQGRFGTLAQAVDIEALRLVAASPEVAPQEAEALVAALPDTLAGLPLPPPSVVRQTRRAAEQRAARLTLGAETARDGPRYWDNTVVLPTLTLRFVYEGQEVGEEDGDPRMVLDGEIVTIARDPRWEAACATRLMEAGALPVEELEIHRPGERMTAWDFVFAENEMNLHTSRLPRRASQSSLPFALYPHCAATAGR